MERKGVQRVAGLRPCPSVIRKPETPQDARIFDSTAPRRPEAPPERPPVPRKPPMGIPGSGIGNRPGALPGTPTLVSNARLFIF